MTPSHLRNNCAVRIFKKHRSPNGIILIGKWRTKTIWIFKFFSPR